MDPGHRVDRFVVERLIGRGGMAEVYSARDTQLGRRVALKRIRAGSGDATSTVRFLREARFGSAFHHPCAVVVYDIFEHDNQPYIAMEYVDGKSLRAFVGDPSVPAPRRIRWLVDVARALGAAHRAGLVHRDVKPHNVLVTEDQRVKVLDFGIALANRTSVRPQAGDADEDSLQRITQTGAIVGTPLYAAPEQLAGGEVDGRSDQYSWALTGYELLCGHLPWRHRNTMSVLAQLAADDVPSMGERLMELAAAARAAADRSPRLGESLPQAPNPAIFDGVPLGVEAVISCAMSRDPERRFPTIDDAADALEEYAEDLRSLRGTWRALRGGASNESPPARSGAAPSPRSTPVSGASDSSPQRQRAQLPPSSREEVAIHSSSASVTSVSATSQSARSSPTNAAPTSVEAPPAVVPPPPKRRLDVARKPWIAISITGALLLLAMLAFSRLIERAPTVGADAPPVAASHVTNSPEIQAVHCGIAEVNGALGDARSAEILGSAACLRLAIEVGVPWVPRSQAASLRVAVDASAPVVTASLSFGDLIATADGSKPIPAIAAAASLLAKKLRAKPWTSAERLAWGDGNEDEARRTWREVRWLGAALGRDPRADLLRWAERRPEDPWAFLLLANASAPGDPAARAARDRLTSLASRLSPSRSSVALAAGNGADAIRSLQRAYVLSPSDREVSALLAAALFRAGRSDEAGAIALRDLAADLSSNDHASLPALVLASDVDPDPAAIDRRDRLFAALDPWIPESFAWWPRVRQEIDRGRVDEASRLVAVGSALGVPSSERRGDLDRAQIALASLDVETAASRARPFLVSPDPALADEALHVVVRSLLLQGRATDAAAELARDIDRQTAIGNDVLRAARFAALLALHRRIDLPPPPFADPAALTALASRVVADSPSIANSLEIELFFVRVVRASDAAKQAIDRLHDADLRATTAAQGDRVLRDATLFASAPLLAIAWSPKEQLAWLKALDKAPFVARLPHLLTLGILSDRQGERASAERALRDVLAVPLTSDGLDLLASRVLLARILDERRAPDEAAAIRAPLAKLLANADPAVVAWLDRIGKQR